MFKVIKERIYIFFLLVFLSYWYFISVRETVYSTVLSDFLSKYHFVTLGLLAFIPAFSLFFPLIISEIRKKRNPDRKISAYAIFVTTLITLLCFYGLPYFEAIVSNVDVKTVKYVIYAKSLDRHSGFVWLRLTLLMIFIGQASVDVGEWIEKKKLE